MENEVNNDASLDEDASVSHESHECVDCHDGGSHEGAGAKIAAYVIGGLALLGAIGVAIYFAFFGLTPDQVILKSISEYKGLTSYHADIEVTYNDEYTKAHIDSDEYDDFILESQDMYDKTGIDLKKSFLTMSLSVDGADKNILNNDFEYTLEAFADRDMNDPEFGIASRIADGVLYFNVTDLPSNPIVSMFGLDEFIDLWVRVDRNDDPMFKKEFEDFESQIDLQKDLTPEQEQELMDIIAGKKLVIVKEVFDDEKINGRNSYHYAYEIDEEVFIELSEKIIEFSDDDVDTSDLEEFVEGLDEFFEENDIVGEIWIDKKSLFVNRITVVSFVNVDIVYSQQNEDIEIVAPEESEGLLEVFGRITEKYINSFIGAGVGSDLDSPTDGFVY